MAATGAQPGDLLLLAAGPADIVAKGLDRVRQFLARDLGLVAKDGTGGPPKQHSLLWVVDFPMFEFSPEEQRWVVEGGGCVEGGGERWEKIVSGGVPHGCVELQEIEVGGGREVCMKISPPPPFPSHRVF